MAHLLLCTNCHEFFSLSMHDEYVIGVLHAPQNNWTTFLTQNQ